MRARRLRGVEREGESRSTEPSSHRSPRGSRVCVSVGMSLGCAGDMPSSVGYLLVGGAGKQAFCVTA